MSMPRYSAALQSRECAAAMVAVSERGCQLCYGLRPSTYMDRAPPGILPRVPGGPLGSIAPPSGIAVSKTAATVTLALRPRAAGATLLRWLYDEIRLAIVEGRLAPGARLPSTRGIARAVPRGARDGGRGLRAPDRRGIHRRKRRQRLFRAQSDSAGAAASAAPRARSRAAVVAPSLSVRGRRLVEPSVSRCASPAGRTPSAWTWRHSRRSPSRPGAGSAARCLRNGVPTSAHARRYARIPATCGRPSRTTSA